MSGKYRIHRAEIGWNVVCPCGTWLEKGMTFEQVMWLFSWMARGRIC